MEHSLSTVRFLDDTMTAARTLPKVDVENYAGFALN
jgi:hypothetical protein